MISRVIRPGERPAAVSLNLLQFEEARQSLRSFEDLAAAAYRYESIRGNHSTELVQVELVSNAYFRALGIRPDAGRFFGTEEETARQTDVVVLSRALSQEQFGGSQVLGRSVRIGERQFVVVGIAPAAFDGVRLAGTVHTQAWIPLAALSNRDSAGLIAFGRLKTSFSMSQASAEVAAFEHATAPLSNAHGPSQGTWFAQSLDPNGDVPATVRQEGALALALTLLVLMVAATNLAHLSLSRGVSRRYDLALQASLGATKGQLVREQLWEQALIAMLAAPLTLVLLHLISVAAVPELPLSSSETVRVHITYGWDAILVCASVLLLVMVVSSLRPAMETAKASLRNYLSIMSGGPTAQRAVWHGKLLRWQVSVSVVFLAVCAVTARTLLAGATHDSGIELSRLAIVAVDIPAQWEQGRINPMVRELQRRMEITPGFRSASVAAGLPFGVRFTPFARVGRTAPSAASQDRGSVLLIPATADIFRTLGIPLLHGNTFDDTEAAVDKQAVLSATLARRLFASTSPMGQQVYVSGVRGSKNAFDAFRVVGVAQDTDEGFFLSRGVGAIYIPLDDQFQTRLAIVAKSDLAPSFAAEQLRVIVRQTDDQLALFLSGSGTRVMAGPYVLLRFVGQFSLALALITLAFASVGLYGVLSQNVTGRRREFGLRMALGARSGQVLWLVLAQGLAPIAGGSIIGLTICVPILILGKSITLTPLTLSDVTILAGTQVLLLLVGVCATYLPARRATLVDPAVALRDL